MTPPALATALADVASWPDTAHSVVLLAPEARQLDAATTPVRRCPGHTRLPNFPVAPERIERALRRVTPRADVPLGERVKCDSIGQFFLPLTSVPNCQA